MSEQADIIAVLLELVEDDTWEFEDRRDGEHNTCRGCGVSRKLGPIAEDVPDNYPENLHDEKCPRMEIIRTARAWLEANK